MNLRVSFKDYVVRFNVKGHLVTLLAAVLAVGCNSRDTTDLRHDATQLGQTAKRAATNATVAGKVETALALRKGVDIKGLHVEADGTTVTLSGHVNSAEEKKIVLDVANNTVGVDKVIDQIKVEAPAKPLGGT